MALNRTGVSVVVVTTRRVAPVLALCPEYINQSF